MAASSERAVDVEEAVCSLIAEMTGESGSASLLAATLDSLTLIAIVTRIEAAFAIAFESDEVVALLGAQDASALARLVARKVAAKSANLDEPAGNDGC